jgi:RNA polymerase subunit RPABC4/transcription elongation factor Spt4
VDHAWRCEDCNTYMKYESDLCPECHGFSEFDDEEEEAEVW